MEKDLFKEIPIGFIGCGNMAQAIIKALNENGFTNIFASDVNIEQLNTVSGLVTAQDNAGVIKNSKFIFLCIKPQNAKDVLSGLDFDESSIIISIMAGVPIKTIIEYTKSKNIVRVMPNLNAAVKMSYNAFCASETLTEQEKKEVATLLSSFGTADEVQESMINAVTGISGSGPAYVFRFVKGLLLETEAQGFSPSAAVRMCLTLLGGTISTIALSFLPVFADDSHSAAFSDVIGALDKKTESVCSKGGTTEQGVKYLDNHNFSDIVKEAAAKAIQRAEELSK